MKGSRLNLIGQRFGKLLVKTRLEGYPPKYRVLWKCICDCGNECKVRTDGLRGGVISCGCRVAEVRLLRVVDLIGQRFGRLAVEEFAERKPGRKARFFWKVRCDCGKQFDIDGHSLRSGNTQSCGCLSKDFSAQLNRVSILGQKFGRLLVIGETSKRDRAGNIAWLCLCDCGVEKKVSGASLRKGVSQSCGCLCLERRTTHGLSGTRQYSRMSGAKRRAAKLQRTPPWSNLKLIKEIYLKCPQDCHVDHVIPLRGKTVSGLHVPDNLQYLSSSANMQKHNKFVAQFIFANL